MIGGTTVLLEPSRAPVDFLGGIHPCPSHSCDAEPPLRCDKLAHTHHERQFGLGVPSALPRETHGFQGLPGRAPGVKAMVDDRGGLTNSYMRRKTT